MKNNLLKLEGATTVVKVPSVHDLLADKLCAYAPNSVGKKLGEDRDVEVIKQMYDVSYLFDHYKLNPSFHNIYKNIAEEEIKSRGLDMSYQDTIIDTIRTSLNILLEGKLDSKQYSLLKGAIRRFVSFVRDHSFNIEKAKVCAIKNVFAALLVLTEGYEQFEEIAKNQEDFIPGYKIFKSTKKWLRITNFNLYPKFDDCLKVMSYFKIELQ